VSKAVAMILEGSVTATPHRLVPKSIAMILPINGKGNEAVMISAIFALSKIWK
jgi:hypothetical protein